MTNAYLVVALCKFITKYILGLIKGGHRLLKKVITFKSVVVDVENRLNVSKNMAEKM